MSQGFSILLIDDNPGDRLLAIRELKREFPQVQIQEIREAESFAQAVATGTFNLVITDYQLGWSNGLEVLRTLKARYPTRPVIMFTNTGSEEIAVESMKAGLNDYVLKQPNRYVRLAAAVRVALERVEAEQRAARLDLRLQALLNQLNVGVFRSDANGNLLECNPALLNVLGVDSIAQAQAVLPLDLRQQYLQLARLVPPQHQHQETQIQGSDGKPMWVVFSTMLNPVDDETVLDGLIEDITERKRAEMQLQHLNEVLEGRVTERTAQLEATNRELESTNQRLATANQNLQDFAYSVSHDLRAPLRAIQAFAQILLEEHTNQLDAIGQDYLQRIYVDTQQTDRLIQDLLAYSQLSQADIPLQPIDLERVVTSVLMQLAPELEQRQARVVVEPFTGMAIADRLTLTQVLTNLLTNAIKFVAPGVQPQVRLWAETRGDRIRLWIADNGIGIAPEAQQRIFNVFERLHGGEVYPGTGIGLAIVRKGIEQMNGQIGVESQPGQGSRFWIELSLA
ncbi:response regulator [Oculatella sp. LEGE 06141]|uniref:sensor histidine kinase n=1 Tax=Oculatella sp. LEGE 06141 TaxID=1828648 RepID=UPI001880825B|nr:ATP-binding protein [Oculatella sp. LEGE 06141]MBE9178798.1 response regulator [Oculatella sp. LEGE 06141]